MIKAKSTPLIRIQKICAGIQSALKDSGLTDPAPQQQTTDNRQKLYLSLKKQIADLSK